MVPILILKKIAERLGLDYTLFKTVSKVSTGNIVSQVFRYTFWFAVLWIVSVEEYGALRYAFTIASFLSLPVVSGFGGAITKFISEHRYDKVSIYAFHTIFLDTIVLSLVLVVGFALNIWFSESVPLASIFFVIILAIYNLYYAVVRGVLDIKRLIWFGILVNSLRVGFVFVFFILSLYGMFTILIAYALPVFIAAGILTFFREKNIDFRFYSINKKIIRKIFRFSVFGFTNAFFVMFIGQINIIIIKIYFGLDDVAYYSLAFTLASVGQFITGGIIATQVPVISGLKQNKKKIFVNTKKYLRLGFVILSSFCFFLGAITPLVFRFLIRADYAQSFEMVYLLIPGTFFSGLFAILSATWIGYGKPEESVRLVALGVPLILIFNGFFISYFGTYGSAIAYTLTQTIVFLIAYYYTINYFSSEIKIKVNNL